MTGENFENADTLETTPAYRRQLRPLGVGLAAAGATSLLLNRPEEDTADGEAGPNDETAVDAGTETGNRWLRPSGESHRRPGTVL